MTAGLVLAAPVEEPGQWGRRGYPLRRSRQRCWAAGRCPAGSLLGWVAECGGRGPLPKAGGPPEEGTPCLV